MQVRARTNFEMIIKVRAFCDEIKEHTAAIKGVAACITELDGCIKTVRDAQLILNAPQTKLTDYLLGKRYKLQQALLPVLHAMQGLATVNDDPILSNKVKLTDSQLKTMRYFDLYMRCDGLIVDAQKLKNELADYMVTDAMLQQLTISYTEYSAALSEVSRMKVGIPTAKTNSDKAIFKGLKILSGRLDKLIGLLQYSKPDVYAAYKMARRHKEPAGKHRALTLRVIESSGNLPIQGVRISIFPQPETPATNNATLTGNKPLLHKVSSANGLCWQKDVAEGNYSLTAYKHGFVPLTLPFSVTHKETTRLVLMMERIG